MKFTQYYLDCLSQASYLDRRRDRPAERWWSTRGATPTNTCATHAEAAGLTIEMDHRDALPRRLLVGPPSSSPLMRPAPRSRSRRWPRPSSRRGNSPTANGTRTRRGRARDPAHARVTRPESVSIVVWEHAGDDDAPRRADRRHAVHRRRRPPRPAGVDRFTATSWPTSSTTACTTSCCRCPTPPGCIPAHGAGSACGKNLSTETWSTIGGAAHAANYALLAADKRAVHRAGHRGPAPGARATASTTPC